MSAKNKNSTYPTSILAIVGIVLTLLLCSCGTVNKKIGQLLYGDKADAPTELRIVDLKGDPRPVKTFVPELNEQIINSRNNPGSAEIESSDLSAARNYSSASQNAYDTPLQQQNAQPVFNSGLGAKSPAPQAAAGSAGQNIGQNIAQSTTSSFAPEQAAPIVPIALAQDNSSKQSSSSPNSIPAEEATIEYDMSEVTQEKTAAPAPVAKKTPDLAPKAEKKQKLVAPADKNPPVQAESSKTYAVNGKLLFFVQIGSYASKESANDTLNVNKNNHYKGKIEKVLLGEKEMYRVFIGPAKDKKHAHTLVRELSNLGYKDAFIVKK